MTDTVESFITLPIYVAIYIRVRWVQTVPGLTVLYNCTLTTPLCFHRAFPEYVTQPLCTLRTSHHTRSDALECYLRPTNTPPKQSAVILDANMFCLEEE